MTDDWTAGTVKEHVLALLAAEAKRNDQRYQATEAALRRTEAAAEAHRKEVRGLRMMVIAILGLIASFAAALIAFVRN